MTKDCKSKGFTLMELLILIMIIAIIGAYAVAQFPNPLVFRQNSVTEQLKRDIRYAQTLALSLDMAYTLTTVTNGYTISPVPPQGPVDVTMPSGISLSAATIVFNTLGNPGNSAITINVQATGLSNKTIVVTAETGYVA